LKVNSLPVNGPIFSPSEEIDLCILLLSWGFDKKDFRIHQRELVNSSPLVFTEGLYYFCRLFFRKRKRRIFKIFVV